MILDRADFAEKLAVALAGLDPVQRVRDVLHRVLIAEPLSWDSGEERLVRHCAERLDTMSDDTHRFLALAQDIQRLLAHVTSNDGVELLLEVIAERQRLVRVIQKYIDETISRTNLLSFISEQQWSVEVKRRLAALTASDPEGLVDVLESADVRRLEALLVG